MTPLTLMVCFFGALLAQIPHTTAIDPENGQGLLKDVEICDTLTQQLTTGFEVMMNYYNASCGLFGNCLWWNSANVVTTIGDYLELFPDQKYRYTQLISDVFRGGQAFNLKHYGQQRKLSELNSTIPSPPIDLGYTNDFYDDDGWWALAWIKMYDVFGDARYLTAAQQIFGNMTDGWDSHCGGGINWSFNRNYKNAIANELFMDIAGKLANRATNSWDQHALYSRWAKMDADWFLHSGMINSNFQVNDGLDENTCKSNGQTPWSYNQGVILAGLSEVARLQNESFYLQAASKIANAALKYSTDDRGILFDPCNGNCWDGDGAQFKGIFARNLASFYVDHHSDINYKQFLETNARYIWKNNRNDQNQFGYNWAGPMTNTSVVTHSSAMDAIIGAFRANKCSSQPMLLFK